ncbi:MarR family transcriptional regulator [Actinoplanes sp. NPDC051346]|uniref:MarR family winged helix-turn-helix transcriptional regulator n=1 Tax=Actinoplanes sp. NPDC051346 TaxID=3155048 RepID=UPI0034267C57
MEQSTGLEHMICFELYAASRAMTSLYRPALDTHGLTYPQYVALRVIWHRGRITVRDLGAALRLDSGTLSPLLKRLESQDLIRRERGTDDERVVWISTTPAGTALRQQVADLPQRLACALDLTVEDFTTLQHLLSRIRGAATTSAI